MITSVTELNARNAIADEDARAVLERKIARLTGRAYPATQSPKAQPAQLLPLHRGLVERGPDPLPAATFREFAAIIRLSDGRVHERTKWATSSMEVLVGEVERLAREGVAGAHIEVRPVRRGAA